MPKIKPEIEEEHLRIINTLMVLNPKITNQQIRNTLREQYGEGAYDKNYIGRLRRQIKSERMARYTDAKKDEAMSAYEDGVAWIVGQLRKILSQSDLDPAVRVKALKEIRKSLQDVLNMKMDLGIFERQIGKIKSEESVIELMNQVNAYREKEKPVIVDAKAIRRTDGDRKSS